MAGLPITEPFYETVSFSRSLLDPEDHPAMDLGVLIARFVNYSSYLKACEHRDTRPTPSSTLQRLFELDAAFADWELGLSGIWPYRTVEAAHLPSAAVFEGEYHVYYDMWTARVWSHYRWARLLVNQTILGVVHKYAQYGLDLLSTEEHDLCYKTIQKLSKDTLVSTPSHWRHPLLDEHSGVPVEKPGGAGSGSAGIPVVIFQLAVAACAPGLPAGYWDWTYEIMECIWGDLGMLHAKSMMAAMKTHRDGLQQAKTGESIASKT